MVENDVDAAALAEQAHGHGREFDTFAFVSIGTGIGMGLVIDGQLHRGVNGVAGEIAFMPISEGRGGRRGRPAPRHARGLGAAAAVVRAARRAGMRGLGHRPPGLRGGRGRRRAGRRGRRPGPAGRRLVRSITVVDPALVVLGGGIGQAPGFAQAVDPSSGDRPSPAR